MNIIVQKCQISMTFYKLMEKDGKASCTIWLDEFPTICDLYVNERDRRQGLATRMLKKCEELVKAEGYQGVWLYADDDSWLVEWYRRKGYERTGETLQLFGQTVTSVGYTKNSKDTGSPSGLLFSCRALPKWEGSRRLPAILTRSALKRPQMSRILTDRKTFTRRETTQNRGTSGFSGT